MDLKSFSDSDLLAEMKLKVETEKRTTAEIIEFVKEVERRRLFIKLEFNSLFDFMTEYFGYTPGSAQRRIDAARLLRDIPEVKRDLESGDLNLMQVSALARAVREKEKTTHVSIKEKREIIETIKSQDLAKSEATIAKMLDIPIKTKETKRIQQDGSVRRELTFSKEQEELLEQVKSLMSHVNPNPTFPEMFEYLAKRYVKEKVGTPKPVDMNSIEAKASSERLDLRTQVTAKMAVTPKSLSKDIRYVSASNRKQLFQKQGCCQWRKDGEICGSKFQLQTDHIQPIWADGTSEPPNLQLLCGFHNRLKYRRESGRRP